MNILQELHDKLNASVIGNISSIANETSQDTSKALEQLSALFLGVLTHEPITSQQVEKIQTVLDEGGHTGDLLDNLSFLLGDKQRASILVSIGTNIFNHFYTGDFDTLTEKISIVLGVKKSGIQTLLGLTPPLVLASLGRIIRREKMGSADIKNLLVEQQSVIKEWLSPYLVPQLSQSGFRETSTVSFQSNIQPEPISVSTNKPTGIEEKVDGGKRKKVTKKPTLFQTFLPWGLLLFVLGGSIFYMRHLRNSVKEVKKSETENPLPLLDDNSNLSFLDSNNAAEQPVIEEKKQEVVTNVTPPKAEEITPKTAPKVESVPVEKTKQSTKTTKNTTTTAHSGIFKNTFSSNSAEIKNDQVISDFFKKWQSNTNQIIDIQYIKNSTRLFEDQSYAVREALYRLGVPLKQIKVTEKNTLGGEKIKVVIQ